MIHPARLLALLLVLTVLVSVPRAERAAIRLADRLDPGTPARRERCDVGGDSRESVVLDAGQGIELSVRVPPRGVLRFALSRRAAAAPPPAWELTVVEEGTAALLAEDRTALGYRWDEREIDLARWAGRVVRLQARVDAPGESTTPSACWANAVLMPRPRPGRLVIVVLLDTVRADHLALLGYERPTSPALAALGRDGVVFEDAGSDASWTRASVASLFTGESALAHGVLSRDAHLGPRWTTMAERFRAAGARTVALSTNPNVLPFWGFARGFDRFVDVGAEEWTANSDAARVLAVAREVVEAAGAEATFLYIHINDAHAPYDPPAATATRLLGSYDPASPGRVLAPSATTTEVQAAVDRYDAEIAHLDEQLGRLFADLDRRGRYRSSLIVVVGDHGEEFLDHGGIYHGHTLFREQLHVPLVFKLPDLAGAGTRVHAPVSLLDVLPTMLAVLGMWSEPLPGRPLVSANGSALPGASLPQLAVTDMDDRTVYAAEDERSTLIVQTRPRFQRWLFARATDPRQRHELSARAPAELERMQRLLDDHLLVRRAGWHLRVCGGTTAAMLRLRLEGPPPLTRTERIDLEPADQLEVLADGSGLVLTADLTPQRRHEELFGKLVARTRADRDELVFESAGPLRVTVEGPDAPALRIGATGARLASSGAPVTLEDAAAPAVYAPECGDEPAVFLWHAGTRARESAADPDIARRLRALGYLQ